MSKPPRYLPGNPVVPQAQFAAYRATQHVIEDQLIDQIIGWRGRLWQGIAFPGEISLHLVDKGEITKGYYLMPGQVKADPPYIIVRYVPQSVRNIREAWQDTRKPSFDGKMDFALAALHAWLTEVGWTVIPHLAPRRPDYYAPELLVYPKKGGDASATP